MIGWAPVANPGSRCSLQPISHAQKDEKKNCKVPNNNHSSYCGKHGHGKYRNQNLGGTPTRLMAQTVTTVAKQTTLQPCTAAQTNCHYLLHQVTILEIWRVPALIPSAQKPTTATIQACYLSSACDVAHRASTHNTSTPTKSHDHHLHIHLTDHFGTTGIPTNNDIHILGLSH